MVDSCGSLANLLFLPILMEAFDTHDSNNLYLEHRPYESPTATKASY